MVEPSNRGADFFIVTALTLTLCTVLLVSLPSVMPRSWAEWLALVLSTGIGVVVLARRHGARSVPVIAVYIPAMFILILLVTFQIAWHEGRVEL
jgi:hypothetical protein